MPKLVVIESISENQPCLTISSRAELFTQCVVVASSITHPAASSREPCISRSYLGVLSSVQAGDRSDGRSSCDLFLCAVDANSFGL